MVTAMASDAVDLVTCECGASVAPTLPGGDRPRAHIDPRTDQPCRITRSTSAVCKRCGGTPHSPNTVTRRGSEVRCSSDVFHPRSWTAGGAEVGNAAAAGEILGVSGEQFQWLARQPPADSPRRAPEPAGYDFASGARYWDLEQVRAYAARRPGIPSRGAGSPEPAPEA